MMLVEVSQVPVAALPVAALREHLRLGSGFAGADLQDGLLEGHLRAAMAAIEGRIGKALIARAFRLELEDWRGAEQPLPLAPVVSVASVTLVDAAGGETTVEAARWRLVRDTHRPKLAGKGGALPMVPVEGRVEVVFEAGFGAGWTELPPDLAQAVLLLAAEFYERRHEVGDPAAALPGTVQALIARWRTVRVLGGGAG